MRSHAVTDLDTPSTSKCPNVMWTRSFSCP